LSQEGGEKKKVHVTLLPIRKKKKREKRRCRFYLKKEKAPVIEFEVYGKKGKVTPQSPPKEEGVEESRPTWRKSGNLDEKKKRKTEKERNLNQRLKERPCRVTFSQERGG